MLVSILISVGVSLVISLIGVAAKTAAVGSAAGIINNLFSIANLNSWGGFDAPSNAMLLQAIAMLVNLMFYAQKLVMAGAFFMIIFNAFKLWGGTMELKKAFVDMVYKTMVVLVIMAIYPTVTLKILNLSTQLGVEASGGYEAVMTSFSKMAENTKEIWESGSKEFVEILKTGAKDENGKTIISEDLLKTFEDIGMTTDEAKQWATQHNLEFGDSGASGIWFWKNDQAKRESNAKKALNDKQKKKKMKQSLAIIRAMSQLLTGTPDTYLVDEGGEEYISAIDLMNMGNEQLNKIFYNPFIEGTKRLSTSAMIKTAIVIATIASEGSLASINDNFDEENNPSMKDVSESDTTTFIGWLAGLFKSFVYKMSMVLAMIFIMLEYVICVIEYLIVAAVSCILIPLFFIDATKQFATNILKMFLAYFTKILVTTMMCFFTVSMYIELGAEFCKKTDLSSISTVIVYVFTIALGIFLCKNSGRIASAVISGNPSLGMGDLAREIRGGLHSMHHAGQMLDRGFDKAAKTAQTIGKRGAEINANREAADFSAGKAARAARNDIIQKGKSGEFASVNPADLNSNDPAVRQAARDSLAKQANEVRKKAYGSAMRASMGEFAKDKMFGALTGGMVRNGGQGNSSFGRLIIGQEFYDEENKQWRKANFDDVQKRNKQLADLAGNKIISQYLKEKEEEGKRNIREKDKDWPEVGL